MSVRWNSGNVWEGVNCTDCGHDLEELGDGSNLVCSHCRVHYAYPVTLCKDQNYEDSKDTDIKKRITKIISRAVDKIITLDFK